MASFLEKVKRTKKQTALQREAKVIKHCHNIVKKYQIQYNNTQRTNPGQGKVRDKRCPVPTREKQVLEPTVEKGSETPYFTPQLTPGEAG